MTSPPRPLPLTAQWIASHGLYELTRVASVPAAKGTPEAIMVLTGITSWSAASP